MTPVDRGADTSFDDIGTARRILSLLRRVGVLPFSHPRIVSVVSSVVGAPVTGSWWGHPAGHRIYAVGERLERSSVILSTSLVEGRSTLVHAKLWPALIAVGRSHQPWQMTGMTAAERVLYDRVEKRGVVRVQQESIGLPLRERETPGDVARRLERRVLVLGRSVHTSTGQHEKILESWGEVARDRGIPTRPREQAFRELDGAVDRLSVRGGPSIRRPWR